MTHNTCDHCGRIATLGICENSNKLHLTGQYSCDGFVELWNSENSIVIDGSQFQLDMEKTNIIPSVWTGSHKLDKIMNELEQTIKKRAEIEASQKDILEYLKVTADMAENNDELACRIWQVYERLEDLWKMPSCLKPE